MRNRNKFGRYDKEQPHVGKKKLCKCGCGQETQMVTHTDKKRGLKNGDYADYIKGHSARKNVKIRRCLECGSEISRYSPSGRRLSPEAYKRLVFCSQECSAQYHSGENSSNWKGGKRIDKNGYIYLLVGKDHHLADQYGYALEHRVVAEEKIGRRLKDEEVVHHINGDRHDNRSENLKVFPDSASHLHSHREANK